MIHCHLISPQKLTTYKKIESATLPTKSGEIQILPHHAEIFVSLDKGKIILEKENGKRIYLSSKKDSLAYFKDDILFIVS